MRNILKSTFLIFLGFILSVLSINYVETRVALKIPPEELWEYAAFFEASTGRNVATIRYKFVDQFSFPVHEDAVAIYNIRDNSIEFDNRLWNQLTLKQQELVFYHETLHAFGVEHYDRVIPGTDCPVSIMHSSVAAPYCVETFYQWYLEDVFNFKRILK